MAVRFWDEVRGAMEASFSCTDHKYLLSTKEDRSLIFSVDANIFVKDRPISCEDQTQCECVEWDGAGDCIRCECDRANICGAPWCEPCV